MQMPIDPQQDPPIKPGQPSEPPQESPPGNPRPEVPPPIQDPGAPPRPEELPGRTPDELPMRRPHGPSALSPATDGRVGGCIGMPGAEPDLGSGHADMPQGII
jgi:hypothetical protein